MPLSTSATPTPGEDFYLHVNSKWLNDTANAIPDDHSSWGGFTKLHNDGLLAQIGLVKELKTPTTNDEANIKSVWDAAQSRLTKWDNDEMESSTTCCELKHFDNEFTNTANVSTATKYLETFGRYVHYTQVHGIANVLDFDKCSDLTNVNNVVLDFSVGGMSLPSREYYESDKFAEKLFLFKQHLHNVHILFQKELNDDDFVENVLAFEQLIANISMHPDQAREYDAYFTNDTLEFYNNINDLTSLPRKQDNYADKDKNFKLTPDQIEQVKTIMETIYDCFDFRSIMETNFNKNFKDDAPEGCPNVHQLVTFDGDGIVRMMDIILNPANRNLYRSYMQYKIINSTSGFASKQVNDEFFDFYSRSLGGQQKKKSHDKRAINTVNGYVGDALGKLYVQKHFPPQSKLTMESMVGNVLQTTKTSLETNDWMSPATKSKALEKLARFRSKIGYPEKTTNTDDLVLGGETDMYEIFKKTRMWKIQHQFFDKVNSKVDKEQWHMTPQTVNAYFSPTQNEIVFPAAILQPPFFHRTLAGSEAGSDVGTVEAGGLYDSSTLDNKYILLALNYGGIGAIIAHEITHGYDDKGRKFDSQGNLNDWWNPVDVEAFEKKTDLMTNYVKQYTHVNPNKEVLTMNPQLTMGENLADIGGLSLSLKTLLAELRAANLAESAITECLQIFFRAWANVWKLNIKSDQRKMLLNIDPHAPTDFRGNLVSHMDEFYRAFAITDTDAMYLQPSKRMKMW